MKEIHEMHKKRIQFIKENLPQGYTLVEIWEHEWDSLCSHDEKVKKFDSDFDMNSLSIFCEIMKFKVWCQIKYLKV